MGTCGHEWQATIGNRTFNNTGCLRCYESKGEKAIANYLTKNNIEFKSEYKFKSCKNKRSLPFDFYVKNKLIEYQGIQHYEPITFGGNKNNAIEKSIERLKAIQFNDKIKKEWCKTNNIPLLEIHYSDFDNIEIILNNFI